MNKKRYAIPRFRPDVSGAALLGIFKKACSPAPIADDGKKNREFEEAFARYIGVKHAVRVPSGRMGLYLILSNLGLAKGSGVVLSAFNYWAVPRMVSFLGFTPGFADIGPQAYTMDVPGAEKLINGAAGALIATHLYGSPCDMDGFRAAARKHKLLVIEDCVQACGAEYKGSKCGSLGDAAYFGFGITKNLALLSGGMVTTDNGDLAARIRAEVSGYGLLDRKRIVMKAATALAMKILTGPALFPFTLYPVMRASLMAGRDIVGGAFEEQERRFGKLPGDYFGLTPSGIAADPGLEQLRGLDGRNDKRIQNALYLLGALRGSGGIQLPGASGTGNKNIFTNFPVRTGNRDRLAGELLRRGIDTSSGYMKAFGKHCPRAAEAERGVLHIPIYSSLSGRELSYMAGAIKASLDTIRL
jgi:dTDP-4-amino-4,6-dideoxygalactose transaminase